MQKLRPPANPNYAATVVKVNTLVELANCDNLLGFPVMGMQAIVSKDTKVGDYGVIFPTEVQLSDEFCSFNNLYRHAEYNVDKEKKGYLEDNRRVRSLKLRGHRSDALFMPLSSLDYAEWDSLKEGDTFDHINGKEICHKYEVVVSQGGKIAAPRVKSRVDARFMPEQPDVLNFLRVVDGLDPWQPVILTQKLHGTNIRIANTFIRREPKWYEKLLMRVGVKVELRETTEVFGSHHVIKDANNPNHRHFYDFDLWSREGKKYASRLPEGYILYGELVGWAGEKPIQPHYTYNVPRGEAALYVYRVAVVNHQGRLVDLSWDAVKDFCAEIGVWHVPELCRTYVKFLPESVLPEYMDKKFTELGSPGSTLLRDAPVPLSSDSPCDEGVCIRAEGLVPRIYKAKAPLFLGHETKMLDEGQPEDVEDTNATEDATAA